MLVSNIPLLTVPTFNAAREAFMVKLHPDDIPAHIWTDPETKEFQQKHHVSYLDAAKEILLLRWEQTWYEKNVHNAKQRDLIHEMDERLKAMDPEANFSVRAQITLAQDTTWERVHSYGMFRMEREKFLTQKMIAHLESKEVRIPVPEQLREFLRFVNGGKAEGNRGKEKR